MIKKPVTKRQSALPSAHGDPRFQLRQANGAFLCDGLAESEANDIINALNNSAKCERYRVALWNINKAAETDMDAREFSSYVIKIAETALEETP